MRIVTSFSQVVALVEEETAIVAVCWFFDSQGFDPIFALCTVEDVARIDQIALLKWNDQIIPAEDLFDPEHLHSDYFFVGPKRIFDNREWLAPIEELRHRAIAIDPVYDEAYRRPINWRHLDNSPPSGSTNLGNPGGTTYCY
ncbi:hypothetical protein HGA91_04110 [candidate division WWE3 bacterium]|nr:hypothetical protein [candidate division WWE3 bacterium]